MNAPVTTGAFADKLPPAAPTLAQLADRLIAADAVLNSHGLTDRQWTAADEAFLDARVAFRGALEAQTGISREMWDLLGGLL